MRTKGWKKVFSFTLIQHTKTKSFIISTVVICFIVSLLCVLTNILPGIINGAKESDGADSGDKNSFEKFLNQGTVYLFDEAEILTAEDKSEISNLFGDRFSEPDSDYGNIVNEISNSEDMKVVIRISRHTDKDGNIYEYEVRSYYTVNAKNHVNALNALFSEGVSRRIMLNAGVAPEKYQDTKINVAVMKTQAGSEGLNAIEGIINTIIPTIIAVILFLLIFTYGTAVAQSIATEKTSRVMELLLTSVHPLAVVIGKVLAMGMVCLLQFILILAVSAGSFALSAPFGWMGSAFELLKTPEIQEALSQSTQAGAVDGVSTADFELAKALDSIGRMFSPGNIILLLVLFLLGFLFYALIAALIGASISRMEDLSAAMSPYSILGVLGFYLSFFPMLVSADAMEMGENTVNPVQIFSYFFPISSPFALPSALMLKTMSPVMSVMAILVLAAFIVLITIVVAKVYEAIILYNGNRIKFGDIIKMAVKK